MRVLYIASEIYPLAKTGGLADVAASLPHAIASYDSDIDIRLLMPAYSGVKDMVTHMGSPIKLGCLLGDFEAELIPCKHPNGLDMYLLDCPAAYERGKGLLYLDEHKNDWADNDLRFALLSRVGAMIAISGGMMGFAPDIIHCNDWQTGLTPAFLHQWAGRTPPCIFTIHNLQFHGNFPAWNRHRLGIAGEYFSVNGLEFHGQISFLKAGIWFSDYLATVSPTYADEITTEEYGAGLAGLISGSKDRLKGILNGISHDEWNAKTDKALVQNYDDDNLALKKHNKRALLSEFNLEESMNKPLIGIVSRLTEQKGIDYFCAAIPNMIEAGVNIIVLGEGDKALETQLCFLQSKFPKNLGLKIGYAEDASHRIIAGCDFLAVPSRFEPCGLTQMYAMRYGTLPIVRHTGGLADTVKDFSLKKEGNGIVFAYPSSDDVYNAVKRATELYRDRRKFFDIRKRAMTEDFSWNASAKSWIELYNHMNNENSVN